MARSGGLSSKQVQLAAAGRRSAIAGLVLKGVTKQSEIRAALRDNHGCVASQAMVSRDISELQEEWRDRRINDYDMMLGRELARIDHLEKEAWSEWARSKERKSIDTAKVVRGAGERTEDIVTKADNLGDSKYLDIVKWCIDRRIKLLGMEQGQSVDLAVQVQAASGDAQMHTTIALRARLERVLTTGSTIS